MTDKLRVDNFAKAVFVQFRLEQAKHGRTGCTCSECEQDMIIAIKRIMNDIGIKGEGK